MHVKLYERKPTALGVVGDLIKKGVKFVIVFRLNKIKWYAQIFKHLAKVFLKPLRHLVFVRLYRFYEVNAVHSRYRSNINGHLHLR